MEAGEGKEADVAEVLEADIMKFAEATEGKAAGEGKGVVEGMVEGTKDAGEGEGSASSVQRPVSSVAGGGKSVVEGMVEGAKDAGEGKGEPDLNTTAADREQVEDTGPEAVNWSCLRLGGLE